MGASAIRLRITMGQGIFKNGRYQPITPYEKTWAHNQTTPEGQADTLRIIVENAKKAPIIFQSANIQWYMKRFNVTKDEAYAVLGYNRPISTMTLAEYRAFRGFAPNPPPVAIIPPG